LVARKLDQRFSLSPSEVFSLFPSDGERVWRERFAGSVGVRGAFSLSSTGGEGRGEEAISVRP
jgi:hypothetical protein